MRSTGTIVSLVTNDGELYYILQAASFLALLSLVHGQLPGWTHGEQNDAAVRTFL